MKKIPPFISFLVFGIVSNSQGNIISNAQLNVKTSLGEKNFFTDSNGLFLYDLADIGYADGETVTVNVTEPFNNEIQTQTYVVEDSFLEENIITELRTRVEKISELQTQNVLHSVGKKPITAENPLPIQLIGSDGNPVKITQQEENRLGSECTGSDGTTGRVLTLTNTSESGSPVSVWVEDQLISQSDMTLSHKATSSTITFDNIEVFNGQTIKVLYYV